jgi:hypothetical protein
VAEWIKKNKIAICCLPKIHYKDTHGLKVKRWEKIFHVNGNQKSARKAIIISDKMDFESKTLLRGKKVIL